MVSSRSLSKRALSGAREARSVKTSLETSSPANTFAHPQQPYEARALSAEEIAIFRDCFNEYVSSESPTARSTRPDLTCAQDQDHGGNISSEEFGRVMRKTSPNVSDEEVAKIIAEVDLDGDGTINFDGRAHHHGVESTSSQALALSPSHSRLPMLTTACMPCEQSSSP